MKKKIALILVLVLLLAGAGVFALYHQQILSFLFPVRNDWVEQDGLRYYHDEDGDPVTGWFLLDGQSYYLDPQRDGAMVTGWLDLDGVRYYLNEEGHLGSGWTEIGGEIYYLWENGALATGWAELPEGLYYLGETGTPHTGWLTLDGAEYLLDESGKAAIGWMDTEEGRYYFDERGVRQTGLLELDGIQYYLDPEGPTTPGWLELETGTVYVTDSCALATGWLELEDGRYYLGEDCHPVTGWLELEGVRYYLDESGEAANGWLTLDGVTHYFLETGEMATGRVEIDGNARYFTESGAYVLLVNRWNPVPEDYKADLVTFKGWQVDRSCYDDLVKMLGDCPAGYSITSAYRSESSQKAIWDKRMATHQANGYSYSGALALTEAYVALPGTSEHQLGLAVDISGVSAQQWLAEHCWEYGFILRYLEGKSEITGIAHERWHFRYVGRDLAMELKDSGLCLEEYLDLLNPGAPTAGNPGTTETEPEATEAAA